MASAGSEDAAATFEPLRPKLMRVAYRMLGSVADAEDMVQEAFIRWIKADRSEVREPEAFLRRAVRILEEAEAAKREAADARDLLRGTVTVGVLPTIAPYLLPEVMAQFTEKFPGVEIVVQEDTTARLLKLAYGYEIDFALVSRPIEDARLEVKELFPEELLLSLPPGHPLTRKRTVAVADLEGERLIVMKEGHCLGDQVLDELVREILLNQELRRRGLKVTDELIAYARAADATDLEIHDTVLIAAAFCMMNRYVDGLATIAPQDPALYAAGAQHLINEGYVPPAAP